MPAEPPNAQRFRHISEAQFRETMLIPLLKAMGYNDVDHYHSQWELGKDIVAWKADTDGTREYVAVVAKVGRVNAKATGDAATITAQIRQAFGSVYLDKVTGDKRRIHRVIVTSTGTIKEPSQKAIRTQLDEHQQRHVRFWDGEKVAKLISKYLPEQSVPEKLEDIRQALQRLESFSVITEVHSEGVAHRIEPKFDGLMIARAEFTFPETSGNEAKRSFQRFLNEGGKVTIPGEYIQSFEQHEELARVFGNEKPASLQLESVQGAPRPVRLKVATTEGPFSYEKIGLQLVKSGLRRSEFRTHPESDPVAIALVFNHNLEPKQATFTLRFELQGREARRAKQALRIWDALASGATLAVLDAETGSLLMSERTITELESPPGELVQYANDLAYIEDRLGWNLTFPDEISERDLLDAKELRRILEHGSYERPFETLSLTITPGPRVDLLSFFPSGEKRWLKLVGSRVEYEILGRSLNLGQEVVVLTVVLPDHERECVADQIQQGAGSLEVNFRQAPGSRGIRSYFPKHLQGEAREEFRRIHGGLDATNETNGDNGPGAQLDKREAQ